MRIDSIWAWTLASTIASISSVDCLFADASRSSRRRFRVAFSSFMAFMLASRRALCSCHFFISSSRRVMTADSGCSTYLTILSVTQFSAFWEVPLRLPDFLTTLRTTWVHLRRSSFSTGRSSSVSDILEGTGDLTNCSRSSSSFSASFRAASRCSLSRSNCAFLRPTYLPTEGGRPLILPSIACVFGAGSSVSLVRLSCEKLLLVCDFLLQSFLLLTVEPLSLESVSRLRGRANSAATSMGIAPVVSFTTSSSLGLHPSTTASPAETEEGNFVNKIIGVLF
ncbi:hypothetical protein O3G_MSEX000569 [Manduca sexta]|nr:hypothetical protein O3G_MSEX000569 [Manduca sexta]